MPVEEAIHLELKIDEAGLGGEEGGAQRLAEERPLFIGQRVDFIEDMAELSTPEPSFGGIGQVRVDALSV
jgi:hypothetical protein